jgi:hypothetical protein
MSCYICGRNSCCGSFHSSEEQKVFERASDAYDRFLEIRQQCRDEYNAIEEEQEEDGADDSD